MNDVMHASKPADRRLQLIGCAALILSPFLLFAVLSIVLGQNVLDAHPVWLDELGYWRSLLSWNEMGLQTGYYGMLEEYAAVGTLGISGLGPILIYGWFVKLFGLTHNTIMLCNAVWISLAALVFCFVRRPRPAVSFTLTAMLMTYAPIVLYCTTSMTECFNYALMLLYLAFLLTYQETRKPWALVLCCVTVIFGCLYRPMYCVLFIPLVMFFSRYRISWRLVLSAIVAIALSGLCFYLSQLAAAPNAQGFTYHLLRAPDLNTFVHMIFSRSKSNLIDYFLHLRRSAMQDAFRLMYCGVTVLCLLASFIALERRGLRPVRLHFGFRPPFFSCFLLLVAAFGITIMIYEVGDWRDYRRLAPFLWLVIAFFITRWRFTLPAVSVLACLATLIVMISQPAVGAFADPDRFTAPENDPAVTAVVNTITFDENAEDPFRNTIRTDLYNYQLMKELHPGMGLQYGWFLTETTGKSRWILTDHLKCPVTGYENVLDQTGYKVYCHID